MNHSFGFMIEALVAVLLVVTIGYCMLLNKRLLRLKADEQSLKATIGELITATEIAERAIGGLCRIVRPGGSVVLVDLVEHKQEWMREQMTHQWLGFDRGSIEKWFGDAGAESMDYDLTGSFAGEKMARNGNRPVEIFVARATLPLTKTKKKKAA